ncbi:MAG: site-specific integrase [Pseudomonadota bacterium]
MSQKKMIASQADPAINSSQLPLNVSEYLLAALSKNTKLAYQQDIKHFLQWGGHIPASPECVASYLAECASHLAIATLSRRVVAIGRAHTALQLDSPTKSELVKATLQGIRRINGSAQRHVLPALKTDIQAMVKGLRGIKGVRDKALLLTGFAGAFRRSELVSLQVEDLQFVDGGVVIHLCRGKTDQMGRGRDIAIPYVRGRTCPVMAIKEWLAQSGIKSGSLFRRVSRYGSVMDQGLSAQSVALIVKARALAAGLNAAQFSGHSLRAGLATSAATAGVSTWKIRQQTGHQSDAMLQRYIRDSQIFKDNPVCTVWRTRKNRG